MNINSIKDELKKGRFLCAYCHRLETHQELSNIQSQYNWTTREANENEPAKMCYGPKCDGKMRPLIEFHSAGRYRRCKVCVKYRDYVKANLSNEYILKRKLEIGKCSLCNKIVTSETARCFDFDHLDRSEKTSNVSQLGNRKMSIKALADEIRKCRLLCVNCHRIHTYVQLNHNSCNMNYIIKMIEGE